MNGSPPDSARPEDPYRPPANPLGPMQPLDSARRKAFWRLMPLLFICYMIAYVDRQNVAVAKLTMMDDLPGFDNAVIGFGAGVFFLGYFLLEIPGTLLVERWSARKWISRIMLTWGIMAGLTAAVKTPMQFYIVRFLLGLAEAGFFPGVIVYLTHWFPKRDRAKALAMFFIASPFALVVSPKISNWFLPIGEDGNPPVWGMVGWQWVYVFWAIPAVILSVVVFFWMTDRPRQAKWLTSEEREALEAELEKEKASTAGGRHMKAWEGLRNPRVLLLSFAFFCVVTGTYAIEFFLPTILKDWYGLDINHVTWLIILPPAMAVIAQMSIGWSSDHRNERRWHATLPLLVGSFALVMAVLTRGDLWLTVALFMLATAGMKGYMPAFWSLPNQFLTASAAAGSIGLINSIGNLGGFVGPSVTGWLEKTTGSFRNGLLIMAGQIVVAATIIFVLASKYSKHDEPAHQEK